LEAFLKYKIDKQENMMRRRPLFATWLLWLICIAAGITGCSKSTSNANPPQTATYVSVMNLAPWGPTVNIYLNGVLSTPNPIPPGSFSNAYGTLPPGTYDFQFKKGTDSVVAEVPATNYDSLTFYTMILYNTGPNSAVKAYRVQDDFTQVQVNSTNYRFFNLSPDTLTVDLFFNGMPVSTGRTMYDNLVPGSSFNTFLPLVGDSYNIQVKQSGNGQVIASSTGMALLQGAAYTVFLSGSSHSQTNPLTINVLRANY
jgi:hypothetical protein